MRPLAILATLVFGSLVPAAAQPPVPETDTVLEAPTVEVENYERVDYEKESINLADLQGEAVYSSKTMRRIGHVDDVYIDSASRTTYLGLEIGGLFEIGDKEVVLPLDQVSVYRRIPAPPDRYAYDPYGGQMPDAARPAEDDPRAEELRRMAAESRAYFERFAYRFADYRIYIEASEEDLEDYPEFDLY